ncbi:carbamoyl-phosphate synthase, small subunit [Caldicellulosiruptor saccharolyticus DSM 8903]|uniref:Carbamoyl phosphate synthase small chain n=1 Tax=Caldicellulosiruptor saccharolyticus (strain ATCC 43494 / DSM 8903 / Tp8T 6331) TaxID=351627 RepID=A4XLM0_CALS8|nr:glutamine-hydrolyzing carbamoyl-phosphate synthase small subunit [Caldicellulosiruptor saccharolyticus]ABP67805.1 carbamoyl-phosphate synthase, small subunit [Caldicellulosiruptor saccharolyticus DSM 8903]
MKKAILVLEDGLTFEGISLGAEGETIGEVVFNTCMTGYQEVLTDPSYNGQIVTMTYPLIGNYGINDEDVESYKPHVEGFIVREACKTPSNFRSKKTLDEYLKEHNIVAIEGVDTRAITEHIRNKGSMFGIISTETDNKELLLNKIAEYKKQKPYLVKEVSTKEMYRIKGNGKRVAVLDFGIKQNILRELSKRGLDLYVFPYNASLDEVMKVNPDGFVFSNGPGDPTDLEEIFDTLKSIISLKKPILGICLGHQLLGLCLGLKTYKLKFGHHGGNHPVKDLTTGKVYITSQNHNYAIEYKEYDKIKITHINVNDKTVEGFAHLDLPIVSVQYHPEASPGPHDSKYVFDQYTKLLNGV